MTCPAAAGLILERRNARRTLKQTGRKTVNLFQQRAQWPHTVQDITKSLDGVWGVVGATGSNGNLYRLERSLQPPTTYKITEYKGDDESAILSESNFDGEQRDEAVKQFARAIGFDV